MSWQFKVFIFLQVSSLVFTAYATLAFWVHALTYHKPPACKECEQLLELQSFSLLVLWFVFAWSVIFQLGFIADKLNRERK
jgi:hypothetical protein